MTKEKEWIWMPHPAHFCGAFECRFRLATYVPSGYIISTVGEYFPCETVTRTFLEGMIDSSKPFKGDKGETYEKTFDDAYLSEIEFAEIGPNRIYETMVFHAKPNPNVDLHQCCPYLIDQDKEEDEVDFKGYNDPVAATRGHYALCEKWSNK